MELNLTGGLWQQLARRARELHYASTNEAVLTVSAETGRAVAIAPGEASIAITGAQYGGPWFLPVTVLP